MSVFSGKKILLAVTGGIAAYKTTYLTRLFIKLGAEVRIIMTPSAQDFVTPLSLGTLSKNPVLVDFKQEEDESLWNNHVDQGLWADIMVIAPATANTLSKMAHGVCDNFLLACYLSAKCPVFCAPAMDLDMYKHPSTKNSLDKLKSFGVQIVPAASGELASGLVGEGRMAEPEDIVSFITQQLSADLPLNGKKVLITAGPTYEAIDPVRFIGNHSSGLMGVELAKKAAALGAEVKLVLGPSRFQLNEQNVEVHRIVSAEEMYVKTHESFENADIVICAAAVSDYRPKSVADQKIKKKTDDLVLELVKNKDILASLGAIKKHQFLVGFALETQDELTHAKGKLAKKNLDAIVLNSLNDKGAGFGHATNKISFIDKKLQVIPFTLKSKADVAEDIFNEIVKRVDA